MSETLEITTRSRQVTPARFSRGSVSSAAGIADLVGLVRSDGRLVRKVDAAPAAFDLGEGRRAP